MRDSSWDWATLVVKLVAPRNMHCDRVGVEKTLSSYHISGSKHLLSHDVSAWLAAYQLSCNMSV